MKNLIFYLTFVILLIALSIPSLAQLQGQALIDSLEAELPNAKGDTNHVKILSSISFAYYTLNPDKGIKFGEQGAELSGKIDWQKGKAISLNNIGVNYWAKSNYPKALEYLHTALEIRKKLGDIYGMAGALGNIGLIYKAQSEYTKALEYLSKSLEMADKLGNKYVIANSLSNIGLVYDLQSDYPKALEFHHKALEIREEISDKKGIATSLLNIGIIYRIQSEYTKSLEYYLKALEIYQELGNKKGIAQSLNNIGVIYKNQSNYPKALEYFHKSFGMYEELGDKNGIASSLVNIGVIYRNQSDYPRALEYFHKSLILMNELGNKNGIAHSLGNIGSLYFNLSQDSVLYQISEPTELVGLNKSINLDRSLDYLHQSILLFEEIGELNYRSDHLKVLSEAYAQKGDYKSYHKYIQQHMTLKDSVFSQEKAKEIGKLEAERERIENENAEKEAARIKEEKDNARNRMQYLGIGGVVVAFGVLLLLSGRMKLSEWIARALVFLSFIFLFEFILVIIDPWTDEYSEGIPLIKFAINMCLALVIFPMHQYFEKRVSLKVVKPDTMNTEQILEEFRKRNKENQ